MNEKQHRPDWTEYFLDIAKAVGRRATCLRRRYGAIIVKDKIIISTGYNGAPRGEAKSIGKEETFAQDLRRQEDIDGVLLRLAEQVGKIASHTPAIAQQLEIAHGAAPLLDALKGP